MVSENCCGKLQKERIIRRNGANFVIGDLMTAHFPGFLNKCVYLLGDIGVWSSYWSTVGENTDI